MFELVENKLKNRSLTFSVSFFEIYFNILAHILKNNKSLIKHFPIKINSLTFLAKKNK